ncbi:hypothetical protein [Abyssisolibacter fermentans]|uniref:hypothetical protein n=1 Tax=Abyssisolibacter fermentans TaxID=1766203 RepID=UPI00082FAD60|nr:hypothetical protein [Abyssisolibacter fermentans]
MKKIGKNHILLVVVLVLVLIVSQGIIAFAAVYVWDRDAVDSGGHLDWDGDTKYTDEVSFAVDLWNGHRPGTIRPDSLTVIEDVWVEDMNVTGGSYGTTTIPSGGGHGTIRLNSYYFDDTFTEDNRNKTTAHEFGHALGLDENNSGVSAIMRQGKYSYSSLHQDDKDSFDDAATRY